jgi:hypothetical protein
MAAPWFCGHRNPVSGEQDVVKDKLKGREGVVEYYRDYGSLRRPGGGSGGGARRGAWADDNGGATTVCAHARGREVLPLL